MGLGKMRMTRRNMSPATCNAKYKAINHKNDTFRQIRLPIANFFVCQNTACYGKQLACAINVRQKFLITWSFPIHGYVYFLSNLYGCVRFRNIRNPFEGIICHGDNYDEPGNPGNMNRISGSLSPRFRHPRILWLWV